MTDAQYQEHFKILGKIARLWEDGGIDTATAKLVISRLFDQVATGEVPSYDALVVLNPYMPALAAAVANDSGVQAQASLMAKAYLTSAAFYGDLTAVPVNTGDGKSVLEALQTEMASDVKTLTDVAATGLVNFFNTVFAPTGVWSTDADVSADYQDSVYVVQAIV